MDGNHSYYFHNLWIAFSDDGLCSPSKQQTLNIQKYLFAKSQNKKGITAIPINAIEAD